MNKVFTTFFSRNLNRIVIASETHRYVGKSSTTKSGVILTALLLQAPITFAETIPVTATSMDAMNGSQLKATNETINANSKAITKINIKLGNLQVSDTNSVKYNADKSTIDLTGVDGTVISNVKNGIIDQSSRDAINGSQLYLANQDVLRESNDYADYKFSRFDKKLNSYSKQANAGIASALALASLGQPTEIGYSMVSVATGTWGGQTSVAIGTSGVSENTSVFGIKGNYVWKMAGTSDNTAKVGGGVSVNFQWK